MASKVVGNQYIYNGPGYLDSKINPVDTPADLEGILLRQRFEGLTVTVLHPDGPDSQPCDYWLIQDPNEEAGVLMWTKKNTGGSGESYEFKTDTPELLDVDVDANNVVTINATDKLASAITSMDDVLEEVEGLKGDVADVQSALTETREVVNTIETRVDTLESGLTQTNERVDTIETRVETVESGLTQTNERVDTIETRVETVETKVETVESGLTQTVEKVETIETRVDTLESGLTETNERVEVVESGFTTIQEIINVLGSGVTENREDITRLESGLTETNTSLEELRETVSGNTEDIEALKGWHIENLGSESGSTKYALVDNSGNTKGDVIEIVNDQFLNDVTYVSAATEDDRAIDPSVIVGDPYLKFTWQYDLVTYVPVKEWVNNYEAGNGISIEASGNTNTVSVKLAAPEEGNLNSLAFDENGAVKLNLMIEIDEVDE